MRETPRAKLAWVDYLALGPDRSLEKLLRFYQVRAAERGQSGAKAVPTLRLNTLKDWSQVYGWQARLQAIADEGARAAEEREAAYRREIMETGYAAAHERVRVLKDLVEALIGDIGLRAKGEDDSPGERLLRLWVREPRGIGTGENFREVELERFNASEIEQLRAALDDIAKEMGQRPRRTVLSGDKEAPVRIVHSAEDLSDGELADIAARNAVAGG